MLNVILFAIGGTLLITMMLVLFNEVFRQINGVGSFSLAGSTILGSVVLLIALVAMDGVWAMDVPDWLIVVAFLSGGFAAIGTLVYDPKSADLNADLDSDMKNAAR